MGDLSNLTSITQEQRDVLLLLAEAKAMGYADIELVVNAGKLVSAKITKKIKYN
jgi:hypothetical protein